MIPGGGEEDQRSRLLREGWRAVGAGMRCVPHTPDAFLSLECTEIRSFQLGEAVDLHELNCRIKLYIINARAEPLRRFRVGLQPGGQGGGAISSNSVSDDAVVDL